MPAERLDPALLHESVGGEWSFIETLRECLLVVLNEEWEHRRYAERDLDALEGRTAD